MSKESCPSSSYGGQAVVEGVMMRGQKHFAVVCKKSNGEIVSTCENVESYLGPFEKLTKVPFIRGSVALVDTMILGMKSLFYSADIALADEETKKEKEVDEKKAKTLNEEKEKAKEALAKSGNKVNGMFIGVSAFLGLAIGVLLFMFVPILLSRLTTNIMLNIDESNKWAFALIEGVFKFILFIVYVWGISFMPDVKRVFSYHGAEHKTINTYEACEELTVENVKKHSKIHARCGTSFILILICISIIIFCFIPNDNILLRLGLKLLLLPFIAGISYEAIKLSGKYKDSFFTKFLMSPGLLVQKITTNEPDDSMIEVAIKSLELVLEKDKEVI